MSYTMKEFMDEKFIVMTENQQEADRFLAECQSMGLRWMDGKRPLDSTAYDKGAFVSKGSIAYSKGWMGMRGLSYDAHRMGSCYNRPIVAFGDVRIGKVFKVRLPGEEHT